MGGPGAGRVARHELNAVPKSQVGHGDRILVNRESPAQSCRCHPDAEHPASSSGVASAQLPPSPPPLTSLHIGNTNSNGSTACAVIGNSNGNHTNNDKSNINNNSNGSNNNNNNNADNQNGVSNGSKANDAMSSPPRRRRGFDATIDDYRRYRRIKARQRGFVCSTP